LDLVLGKLGSKNNILKKNKNKKQQRTLKKKKAEVQKPKGKVTQKSYRVGVVGSTH
jgi:hypothetical protein